MKNRVSIPCALSMRFLTYGFFAIFSQLVFLILAVDVTLSERGPYIARYIYLSCLEYPLLSLALIIGGALLFDYIILH